MKYILQAWLARCLLTCGLAGGPLGLLAQGNVQTTPSLGLAPGTNGNFTLNLAVNLNTPGAVVQAEHFPEGAFQANYPTTRTANRYSAILTVPGQDLNHGMIRTSSSNTPATTFSTEILYTIVTRTTLADYPKVTDRLGKVSFTPSTADRLNPYPTGGSLQRLMITSADYAPLLKDIPSGWRSVSSLVSVAATTETGTVSNFQQNGTLEVFYQDWALTPAEELTMSLFRWNETSLTWEKRACPQPDTLQDRVSVPIERTGTYVLLSMLSVHNAAAYVNPNQQVTQVAATSMRTASLVDSLGVLLARGGTEIILSPGFYTVPGGRFDTQLTGTYCVSATGSAGAAREAVAEGSPAPDIQPRETPASASPAELAAAQLGDGRLAVVHPNPAGAEFTLTYRVRAANESTAGFPGASPGPQPVSIRLYDLNGRLKTVVLAGALKEPGIHHQTVPAGALQPAVYVLELRVGNQPKRTFKVVKQ